MRSVLGRFLEHSRVLVFHAGKTSTYLIGSADMMPRNLDHRVEIMVPIESQRAQAELNTIFDTLLADNRQAWQLDADGLLDAAASPRTARSRRSRRPR